MAPAHERFPLLQCTEAEADAIIGMVSARGIARIARGSKTPDGKRRLVIYAQKHLAQLTIQSVKKAIETYLAENPVPPDATSKFLQQTSLLYANFRTPVVAKPCADCPDPPSPYLPFTTFEESQNYQPVPGSTNFVWIYWHGGAKGDELLYSMRSVEAYFEGKARFTVIGDRPQWYTGHFIPQERTLNQQHRPFRDMLSKIRTASIHPEIDETFVWMMDDTYFLQPVSLAALETPRCDPSYRETANKANSWQKLKLSTVNTLKSAGYAAFDYATHLPHVVEKSKLVTLFSMFDFTNRTYLWEVLYGNVFRNEPESCFPFLFRTLRPVTTAQLDEVSLRSHVFNNGNGAWNEELDNWLKTKYSIPCSVESRPA